MMRFIRELYCRFQDDEVPALAAQVTYYLILSFFPFLIFLLTLTAYTPLNQEQLAGDLIGLFPGSSQAFVTDLLDEVIARRSGALLSAGMIAAVWTSSNGMMALIRTLNKAYDEEERRPYWKVRGMSVLYTFAFAIAVWLAFLLLVFGRTIGRWAFAVLSLPADFEQWWGSLKNGLSLVMMCLIFTLLYISAPSRRIRPGRALPGAIFATVGWAVTSFLFSVYVNQIGSYARTYGSLGGVIALLVWLYLSSMLLLLGGEINATLEFMQEGKSKPGCKAFGYRLPFLGAKTGGRRRKRG